MAISVPKVRGTEQNWQTCSTSVAAGRPSLLPRPLHANLPTVVARWVTEPLGHLTLAHRTDSSEADRLAMTVALRQQASGMLVAVYSVEDLSVAEHCLGAVDADVLVLLGLQPSRHADAVARVVRSRWLAHAPVVVTMAGPANNSAMVRSAVEQALGVAVAANLMDWGETVVLGPGLQAT